MRRGRPSDLAGPSAWVLRAKHDARWAGQVEADKHYRRSKNTEGGPAKGVKGAKGKGYDGALKGGDERFPYGEHHRA